MTVFVGLSGINDYSAAQPFINVLKSGRPWEARSASQWYHTTSDAMRANGHLDANGNPIRIPSGANRVGTIILCEINADDTSLNGRYRLTWTGDGTVQVQGVSGITQGAGWLEFDYRATGGNLVQVELTAISATNPIKLQACVRTDHIALHSAGAIFRPAWLDHVRGFPLFRFMDWQATNNSTQRNWSDRTRVSDYTYAYGAPVEVMVALCNELQADPWFCIPHLATDDYITMFATTVRDNLDDSLTARYEYSNEVWNFTFGQAQWANEQAAILWPDYINQDGWMQFYGARSAQMADLIDAVYAGTTGRHRKVIATHTAWVGLEQAILEAPRWVSMQAGRRAPKHRFDDYAVTGYFGFGLGTQQVQDWRALGEQEAFSRMEGVLNREIDGLVGTWRQQKAIAEKAGLRLVMYEGGSHVLADRGVTDRNAGLLQFIEKFHYSANMGRLYDKAIAAFADSGGEAFNVFVEMMRATIHGFWGGKRHAMDNNPRWDAVIAALDDVYVPPDVEPEPEPVGPTPEPVDPTPEPETPGENPMDKFMQELLIALNRIAAAIESRNTEHPAPVDPVEPEPEPEPAPVLPAEYRATQEFGIDKDLSYDWNSQAINIYLPNWAGGDRGNGVGGSVGTPRRVLYPDSDNVTITAGMENGQWRNGALQLNRPTSAAGKWGAVVTSHTGSAVNAFFTYADNGKELDFELVKRGDVIGWAPAVHMPRTGGGRASSDRRTLALGQFKPGVRQRLEFHLFADRVEFSVDGVVFETVRHADMASGFVWDMTTRMATFATIERHAGWAGWTAADYANESRMTIHGLTLPTMP